MHNLRFIESSNGSASFSCWTWFSGSATVTDILVSGGGMPFPGKPGENWREEEEGQNWICGG